MNDNAIIILKTYDESGALISEWDENLGWFEYGTEFDAFGRQIMNRIFHPYTDEQLANIQIEKDKAELVASRRQLTLEEVLTFVVKQTLNNIDIPDDTSLRMLAYYPEFSDIIGQTVKQGYKFTYDDKLYKTIQPETVIQEHYKPGVGTESLYTRIDETHTGKIFDPIPYEGNMALENGKYYIQNDIIYLCNRNTDIAVYHALSDLVGIYVESISN